MWEVNLRVLGLHVVHELFQAVKESYHREVEPPIVEETPKVQIALAVQLVSRLVAGRLLYPREGTHGHESVTVRQVHKLLGISGRRRHD